MAEVLNRVKVGVASSPGAGATVDLGAADTGYQAFAAAGAVDGATYSYVIEELPLFECGQGKFDLANNRLSRDLVLTSSAGAGARETFTGAAKVFVTELGEDMVKVGDILYSAHSTRVGCVRADGKAYLSSLYPQAAKLLPEAAGVFSGSTAAGLAPSSAFKFRAIFSYKAGDAPLYAVGASGICAYAPNSGAGWTFGLIGARANFNGVGFNNTFVIAVGDGGRVYRSANGLTGWQKMSLPGDPTTNFNAIVWSQRDSIWTIVGDGGAIYTAPSAGDTWTQRASGTTDNLVGVACNNGSGSTLIVAVGSANGRMVWTNNSGVAWSTGQSAGGASASFRAVAVAPTGAKIIAVGAGGVLHYGTNYTAVASNMANMASTGTTQDFLCIDEFASQGTYIIGRADGALAHGNEGGLTHRTSFSGIKATPLKGVTCNGTRLIMIGQDYCVKSTTATSGHAAEVVNSDTVTGAVHGAGVGAILLADRKIFLGVGSPLNDYDLAYVASTGVTLSKVIWTGAQFVIIGSGGLVVTSPDGRDWTVRTGISGVLSGGEGLVTGAYGDGRLVVATSLGRVVHTTDLATFATWTDTGASLGGLAIAVVYLEHMAAWLVARGDGVTRIFSRSLTGSPVSGQTVPSGTTSIAYGNKVTVAAGSGGIYWTLDPLIQAWTLSISDTCLELAYSAGGYAAVMGTGAARVSTDGKSFAASYSPSTLTSGGAIITDGARFYVYGLLTKADYFSYTAASPPQFKAPLLAPIGDGLNAFVRVI